jgi:hypothetical protein
MDAPFALREFMSALLTFILLGAIVFLSGRHCFLSQSHSGLPRAWAWGMIGTKQLRSSFWRVGKNTGEDYGSFANGPARWLDMV